MNTNIQVHDVSKVNVTHDILVVDGNIVYTAKIFLSSDGSPDQYVSLFNDKFIKVSTEQPCRMCKHNKLNSNENLCDKCVYNVYYDSVDNFEMVNEDLEGVEASAEGVEVNEEGIEANEEVK